jgi:hypothetical protein
MSAFSKPPLTFLYAVQVAADAVGSRKTIDNKTGLDRMRIAGVEITSVENSIFELLETSACPEFKQILRLIK